jgi:hypothetical protein
MLLQLMAVRSCTSFFLGGGALVKAVCLTDLFESMDEIKLF